MEHILGEDWTISPAGGSTGEAYVAINEGKRLFLKRNSSPFLAVLSAEGIVPKLVWTKRLENGDVISAQKWLYGRELSQEEMQHPSVAKLLSKIHNSSELLYMLMRLGKKPVSPEDILHTLHQEFKANDFVSEQLLVHQAFRFLNKHLSAVKNQKQVVCHCDMNHNNWMLAENSELYLIDWDSAKVGDPAIDIGTILYKYIPFQDWESWLQEYGIEKTDRLMDRMNWYLIADELLSGLNSLKLSNSTRAEKSMFQLQKLLKYATSGEY